MVIEPLALKQFGSGSGGTPCIWSQAGVVRPKQCLRDYSCFECPFNRALERTAAENRQAAAKGRPFRGPRGKIESWQDRLLKRPQLKRPCIHSLKQKIEFRPCSNDYKCPECEFDHFFQDIYRVYAVVNPVDLLEVKGVHLPQGYYLHLGHAWVKTEEGSQVRIGLDDFALRLLGPLDQIQTPLIGKTVEQGRPGFSIWRGKKKARIQAPVSGVVTEVNTKLQQEASLANTDPYSEGWVMLLYSKDLRRDLQNLMLGTETGQFLSQEVDQLFQVLEEYCGPLAADGGQLGSDISGHLPDAAWERLTGQFLRT
ncbi:MAG: glycine cleavage system protein H [Desulfohalobiaceae bacterium]|nr:glycine cleavage system protein H [Desulfohalobiaceae bacterium]